MQKKIVCELVLSLLVMSYGCFSNKIWLSGTNGCSNLILLVWLNIVELKQGNSCILPQFEAIWIINSSIYISLVDINGIISSGKKGKQGIHNLSLETVHLVTECQIKVRLLNRRPLDLVPLMCRGRDVQGASLV
uniref:Uncharacterized protein n=1 Tax=Rousettus aegyptiacus TaxID=9407 RepID=A0A7J8JGJ5_ROUAE|nr:hypothetical protein HJG63_010278 [Rousettus aegyptiacus]